ncbi:zinc ribbon domain-containing protein [Deinococcus fonticola]|uniref:zinc ribbon domain-containing protein n=1 Tax=Deinococcus fonticola TaxID=2528713 RepID=UPI0010751D3B|nr:zinc ribbon domain-containing protein [Deinococcus fonticola]
MPYTTTDHHWMKILRPSYSTISDLIDQNHLIACRANQCGPRGDLTYQLSPASRIQVINDELLTIAGQEIMAQLNHQPTTAYRAMVLASPGFEQYPDIDVLLKAARHPEPDWSPERFVALLESRVSRGRQPDPRPRLVKEPTTYKSIWRPEQTYLRQNLKGDWLLGLTCQSQYRSGRTGQNKVAVGLDVGLDPVAYAYTAAGQSQEFKPTSLSHLNAVKVMSLTPGARKLHEHLTYASGRLDTEAVIAWLNYHASHVFSEKLSHKGMNRNFIFDARDRAIHDYHFSSLSQYMHTAQHLFKRLPARFTSTYCPCCRERERVLYKGQRRGDSFHCDRCGHRGNAHQVGARNVLLAGIERYGAG